MKSENLSSPGLAVNFLTGTGLFIGQSPEFFKTLTALANQADPAQRGF